MVFLVQALASIVFLRLHPKPLRHTPSYEFTTSFGGVCWGIVVGMSRQWLMYKQNTPGRFMQIIQSRAGVMALIQRVAVGKPVRCSACMQQPFPTRHKIPFCVHLKFLWCHA